MWQRKKSSWKEQVDLRTKKLKEDATSATDDYLLKKKLQIEETKSHEETPEVKKQETSPTIKTHIDIAPITEIQYICFCFVEENDS